MTTLDSKNLIIRADANKHIGAGHVMRCIALGQAWKERGGQVSFFCDTDSDYIKSLIRSEGFKLCLIHNPEHHENRFLDKLSQIRNKRSREGSEWIVIDGYHFYTEFQSKLLDIGYKTIIIDDYHHLSNYQANIILNQNIEAEKLNYKCNSNAKLLLGTKFALIRKEYLKQERKERAIGDIARRLLVTLGGADQNNTTQKIIQSLTPLKNLDIEIKIVIGPSNPNLDKIKKQLTSCSLKAEVLSNVSDMTSLMAWADFAISGAGSTCWELAYLGLPFTTITLAENQKRVAAGLANADIAFNLSYHETLTVDSVTKYLNKVLPDQNHRKYLSDNGFRQIDGRGCVRVLEKIFPSDIILRDATLKDCRYAWEWSNDPLTRAASFTSDVINWKDHKDWFSLKLNNPRHKYYIAKFRTGEPVGQARFALNGNEAVISVCCDEKYRGYGLGSKLIRKASKKIIVEKSIGLIQAFIKKINLQSIRAFEKAGYKKVIDIDYKGIPSIIMELNGRHERNTNDKN